MPRRPGSTADEPLVMLLFPGAGGDRNHSSFTAIEAAVAPVVVHRRDFAYRVKGRRPPPKASVLVEEITTVVEQLDPPPPQGRIVLGGRSMGGRMCSMAVADGLDAAGLILLSYPLHPPGKPERLRTEHFPQIDVPCLFVSGTRDPFGSPDELVAHAEAIAGPVTTRWLDGKGHDPKGCDDVIAEAVRSWLVDLA